MEGVSEDVFSSAGLTHEDDAGIGACHFANRLKDPLHSRARALECKGSLRRFAKWHAPMPASSSWVRPALEKTSSLTPSIRSRGAAMDLSALSIQALSQTRFWRANYSGT